MSTVIKVENLSKLYNLRDVGVATVKSDLQRFWASIRGKEDPAFKLAEVNDRSTKGTSDFVWALKDVSFELKQGEVLGILGKNGAGKSTLLKILSRVSSPTTGSAKLRGRLASLLEVGTGFHPDLSGRDNIYLNGAILGMSRADIKKNFDEIVDFSGIERYIDTPVKRYSSGMYVRLAFAVAAFLESEILIVDEVLAVGDAEFQKKCLGKMSSVMQQNRTILFVSHNISAINTLCTRCLYMKNGEMVSDGPTEQVINEYMSIENVFRSQADFSNEHIGDHVARLLTARLVNRDLENIHHATIEQDIGIEFTYSIQTEGYVPLPNVHIRTAKNEYAFVASDTKASKMSSKGTYKTVMWIPGNFLNDGTYIADIALSTMDPVTGHFYKTDAIVFEVIENQHKRNSGYKQNVPGVIRPVMNWHTQKIS